MRHSAGSAQGSQKSCRRSGHRQRPGAGGVLRGRTPRAAWIRRSARAARALDDLAAKRMGTPSSTSGMERVSATQDSGRGEERIDHRFAWTPIRHIVEPASSGAGRQGSGQTGRSVLIEKLPQLDAVGIFARASRMRRVGGARTGLASKQQELCGARAWFTRKRRLPANALRPTRLNLCRRGFVGLQRRE